MEPSALLNPEAGCVAVLVFGGLQSLYFVIKKPWSPGAPSPRSFDPKLVTSSPLVSPAVLGAWRLLCFAYIVFIGVWQIVTLGTFVFKFYTVWNWWLLAAFFLLSGIQTIARAFPVTKGSHRTTSSLLAYTVTALFHINVTTVALVDSVTWLVLVPMIRQNPDPAHVALMEGMLFNWVSYNQHGTNAALILADLALNNLPFCPYMIGYAGLWSMVFAVWAMYRHAITGRWLYPFMDTSQPWSPIAYLSLYLVHFAYFGTAYLLMRLKAQLLASWKSRNKDDRHVE